MSPQHAVLVTQATAGNDSYPASGRHSDDGLETIIDAPVAYATAEHRPPARRAPHPTGRLRDGLVIPARCTLEPIACGSQQGEPDP